MLQMCSGLGNYKPLYVTGEESLQQIKYRSQRLEGIPDNLLLMSETNIEEIDIAINSSDSGVIIVDSIQAVYSDKIDSSPGSIVQVRECAALLMQTAKKTNKPIFIVGHVTKEGIIAGPKVLEHMVDTVIQFEGEKTYSYRILRAVKNRFGSTNEIGIFEMEETGLREVTNPSELFLAHRLDVDSGISIVAAIEGTRPVLLEVQALVSSSSYSVPQRSVTGFDIRRLQMILAVLEKRMGLRFGSYDIFVNVAGGIYLSDPSVDLGIAIALVSSLRDKPVSLKSVFIGEIGLTGEVRGVSFIDQRINEAQKLGFEKVFLPKASLKKLHNTAKIELFPVERISLVLDELF
jgi:DNA repair protein RadA/Sms